MNTFINECVSYLYDKHKKNISNITILLPSRRSQLFFNIELANKLQGQAIWQPNYESMDSICESVSGLVLGDKTILLSQLYKVYSKYHNEDFDKFYFWGDMLISDFDSIDNYMIDATKIFTNINDIKEIDKLFPDVAEEQINIIENFWRTFNTTQDSTDKIYFSNIWNTLGAIYKEYTQELKNLGIGYKGLIYRTAAEKLSEQTTNPFSKAIYAVIGFNALSKAEKIIFGKIKDSGNADFLWDIDAYYIDSKTHEAGLFVRENIKLFGNSLNTVQNNFKNQKNISVTESPSDSMQCKQVWNFLEDCYTTAQQQGKKLGKETAIVLTDESLLLPVLYSIPPQIEHFNITAGYPLRLTPVYALFEYIIHIYTNRKENKFYKKDIFDILNHTNIKVGFSEEDLCIIEKFKQENSDNKSSYWDCTQISKIGIISEIFRISDNSKIGEYLKESISKIGEYYNSSENISAIQIEFLARLQKEIIHTLGTFDKTGIEISNNILISTLRQHLQNTNVSFMGEPLIGIQIMGILETRNLDFENVLVLSLTDENYPSSSVRSSFIPQNLRFGYGLPTRTYQEAMYSYYFYRLIQRACNIELVYCSSTEGVKNGEESRFISQLRYERVHQLQNKTVSIKINPQKTEKTLQKDEAFFEFIDKIINNKKTLSPSKIADWIYCQAKFTYTHIYGLWVEKESKAEVSAIDFGSIIHKILEDIYKQIEKTVKPYNVKILENIVSSSIIKDSIDKWFEQEMPDNQNNGNIISTKSYLENYIKNVINYDIHSNEDFMIIECEKKISSSIDINGKNIKLFGIIDRLESIGNIDYITDYKTGKNTSSVANLETVFSKENDIDYKPIFQSLLYCYMYQKEQNRNVCPSLFFAREMTNPQYSRKLTIARKELNEYSEVSEEFEEYTKNVISEILDKENTTIERTKSTKKCDYCDFIKICKG